MRQPIVKRSLILVALVGGAAYGWVVLDWFWDMKTGRYDSDPLEAVCQIVVVVAYCYLAYQFITSRLKRSIPLLNQPGVAKAKGKSFPIHWTKKEATGSTVSQWPTGNPAPVQPRKA
ncbi:hypothetical protein EXU85_24490 [Spirosoma sp. KCTC 42546]|uniref:hypothetical protein n=1 Tax=Spirosoma sp. KCTC 42546 TaxID=2520506 RepID=UPI00115847E5|nr:hypothetical protein [Spirosoma sp. KCTC 42546]QDK81598.1 hypothetical protein EXU85_24490 [Spirosoma sp. KCTC 42546]